MIVREILTTPDMPFDYFNDGKDTLNYLHGCVRQVERTGEPFKVYRRDESGKGIQIMMGIPELEAFIADFQKKIDDYHEWCRSKAVEIATAETAVGKVEPKRLDTWKQPTPAMQLISLKNELEGQYGNFIDRITNHQDPQMNKFCAAVERFCRELDDLQPFLESGSW